jgi:hypothetical protein
VCLGKAPRRVWASKALPKASLAPLLAQSDNLVSVELITSESETTTRRVLSFLRKKQPTFLDPCILAYLRYQS